MSLVPRPDPRPAIWPTGGRAVARSSRELHAYTLAGWSAAEREHIRVELAFDIAVHQLHREVNLLEEGHALAGSDPVVQALVARKTAEFAHANNAQLRHFGVRS